MIKRYVLLVFSIMFFSGLLIAQKKVKFTYDQNGNRESRILLTVVQINSEKVSFPVNDPETLKEDKDESNELIDKYVRIYPNPLTTSLTVQIGGYDEDIKRSASVFNLAGDKLKQENNISSEKLLELGNLQDGIYILRITIGDEIFQYKIVKSN